LENIKITPEILKEHNIKIGREPNINELGVFSAMWSEHCAYKNSKPLIKTLPTQGKQILVGPGENAGIVDLGDNIACVFKIESHNHPSAVEPYEGAATGVGGILRDIFTMGARPVAVLDSLRFGRLDNDKTRRLFEGVVAGISGYGNCVGVPTAGGETHFDEAYQDNILVNVMCIGIVEHKYITMASASKPGDKLLYYGNTTGRDGVHGASFASAELEKDKEQRSAVQVGDPFTEKLIMEATIELIKGGYVEGIQDMGAAGLTSSATEMGSRGGCGIKLYLDDIPKRADDITPYEMLLSESQERMVAVVKPEKLKDAKKVLDKWKLHSTVVGEVVKGDHFQAYYGGELVVDIPNSAVVDNAPQYKREIIRSKYLETLKPSGIEKKINKIDINKDILKLVSSPNIASKKFVFSQYDYQVQTNTIIGPGKSGACLIRVRDTKLGIAASTDCNGRYCYLDPYNGAMMAVAEAARNIACVGARPLAISNNLNFANPEKPDIYYQLAECVRGMKDACTALNTPVTGGNASLYNESGGKAIYPTPTVAMIGVIKDYEKHITRDFKEEGEIIYLLGDTKEHLEGSEYLHHVHSAIGKGCPEVNLSHEKALIDCILSLNEESLISSASDISEGGLITTLIEASLINNIGAEINNPLGIGDPYFLFSETPGRVVLSIKEENASVFEDKVKAYAIALYKIGKTCGNKISGAGVNLGLDEIRDVFDNSLVNILKKK
jgi:phosphoribosylformylglycinamidine synthase